MNWFQRILDELAVEYAARKQVKQSDRAHTPARSTPRSTRASTHLVKRNTRPFWQERGWKKNGSHMTGYFRTRVGVFEGKIENANSRSPKLFIKEPSKKILNGKHGACFHDRGRGWYWVHFYPKPQEVNSAIMRLEHTIQESMR
jgi:hypothetical protein